MTTFKNKTKQKQIKKKKNNGDTHVEAGRDEKTLELFLEVSLLYNISYQEKKLMKMCCLLKYGDES